ncbi:MAG: hypothetical protein LBP87_07930 [Planctomycetaceae bacterium]|jgi:hypothetical protein|nr:hypothetical protein [Planctomycetaceae bacterium]
MKNTYLSLEEIADMAAISVEELLEIAGRAPEVALLLDGVPRGVPSSGIPPDPSMYGKLNKYILDDSDVDQDTNFEDE